MYMLDTNTVSYLHRKHPQVVAKVKCTPLSEICISSITEAELLYGIAKHQNRVLKATVHAFLDSIKVYDWDSEAAASYGTLRAAMEKKGKVMGALDQLIAAHALSRRITMVTNDKAFSMIPDLSLEDWTL
ncbi:type II toxin-antitoxin system VapC family toxin [Photorhabdus stackebrandtii]|uniref:Ribonuclease VapC n=1 Tax=Photorhabdus stackebrandtii TaxID=1123042 RepID=A0A7X5QK69_9GAMM|nr:type II toxin-antitoxin system VapC family toxin [Photorhabdus stackebrandtii]NHB95903.1 VapC toxin family PIN domain ribonuclease [Photorhabdus stackebrandtii]